MRKPIILYIAPTRRDVELFLRKTLFQIKKVVRIAEDMMTSHEFASMAIVNIVQTLLSQGVVASLGREKKMENKEA